MAGLVAYRQLLRAARIAFQGDAILLNDARLKAREGFEKNRSADASSKEATDGVQHAIGVAQVLRHNVVQGEQKDGSDVLSMTLPRSQRLED